MSSLDYDNNLLRALRMGMGLSMQEVAKRVGRTRMMIHYAEKGTRCSYALLKRLAYLYEVPMKDLLRDIPAVKKSPLFLPDDVKTS